METPLREVIQPASCNLAASISCVQPKAVSEMQVFAQAKAYAILAMAHSHLGERNEALAALGKGDALAPAFSPEKGADDLGESWVA